MECDYSGIHIHLLYAKEGIDYNILQKDAYQLPSYPQDRKHRSLFKTLQLTAINAKGDKKTDKTQALLKAVK